MDVESTQVAAEQAATLISKILAVLVEQSSASKVAGSSISFFPSGVERVALTFKVGSQVDISLEIAGKDAPAKALMLDESAVSDPEELSA